MPDEITERVENVGFLVKLWQRYPGGFTVIAVVIFFFLGSFWGRIDSKEEVERLTTRNEKLEATQEEVMRASLTKNGIISAQDDTIRKVQNKNQNLTQINDTLSKTINQVGQTLSEAKKPALKILNR